VAAVRIVDIDHTRDLGILDGELGAGGCIEK